METILQQGFIVKRFLPKHQKVSVITLSQGKTSLIIKNVQTCNKLWPGMLISYSLFKKSEQIYDISNLEIIGIFAAESFDDTQWTHCILEICYFFSPLNDPCDEVFIFLTHYFCIIKKVTATLSNRLPVYIVSLLQLLKLFEFYPPQPFFDFETLFANLVAYSIDFDKSQNLESIKESLEAISEKTLHYACLWIKECIKSHPCFASFKTTDILR